MTGASGRFSRKLLFLAVASACAGAAIAAPVGPVVSAGSATYAPATLTVNSATARAQIRWQSFNVAANEVVKFLQPSAQSAVLNLVFNPQSLNILGGISSNGSVLFMSNGMVSGPGVNLDLARVIDTSLRLPRMALALGGVARPAQPHALTTLADGRIYVIGQDQQAVTAANGEVMLNPGKTIELANVSMPNLRVEITAPDAETINLSRLVGNKGDKGIFAGLFRVPDSARQAAGRDADSVLTASAEEHRPIAREIDRFFRYALWHARMRSAAAQDEGGLIKVAALSSGRIVLPAARSRPSVLPQAIEIGAAARRSGDPAAASEPAQALEPQPIPAAGENESERNRGTQLALAPAPPPPAIHPVTTPAPQPVPAAGGNDSERNRVAVFGHAPARPAIEPAATQEQEEIPAPAAAQLPVEPAKAQSSDLDRDAGPARKELREPPAVIVVAMAQQNAAPAPEEERKVKEVRIERRAPRYFTDYRGALFFM